MPLAERIAPDARQRQICEFASRWLITQDLANKIYQMANRLPFGLIMISGFRTKEQQEELREEGRPVAPDEFSTHRTCPATGADLWPDAEPTDLVKATFIKAGTEVGLRVGGGSPVRRVLDVELPEDWNHVDLGPRTLESG